MKSMYIAINTEIYQGARNDFTSCGIRYEVFYQSDRLLDLMLYGITAIDYSIYTSGDKCFAIKTCDGFINVPIEAIEKMYFS